ncbi:MAG: PspC domain-containing protein, partial [Chitinophagaceae bacterium]
MKQVININFQGQVVPIEVTAFDILKQYTDSLNRYFANEEGKEEIINDIENRIGELFQERLKTGVTCITDDDVNAIIKSMGRPEEFEPGDNSAGEQSYNSNAGAQNFAGFNPTGAKRLYRNENSKIIGGVCSGIANYLNIDVVIVRIIFIVLFGALFIPYLVLWIAVPSSASVVIGSPRKRLFRDTDDKVIGGVCSGLSNYFGINVWIPRVLFLLPILSFASRWGHWGDFPDFFRMSFSPTALIIYIILWLVIPEATTTSEKLEMKGEKVDMNSIKASVVEEMKGMQQRAEKFGQDAKAFASDKTKAVGAEMAPLARRSRGLGDIIVLLFKIFAYFIIGCVAIGIIVALFGFGIASVGLFPIKDFVLTDGWQNVFAWGTLIFFIAVPIIGIITWIIRRLAKVRTNSKFLRISFAAMWILGLICFINLIVTVGRDFRSNSTINEEVLPLTNASVNKLEVTTLSPNTKYYRNQWFRIEPFSAVEDDTAMVGNVRVHIIKSPTDSFRVTVLRLANGRNRRSADTLAASIPFNAYQADSLLVIDRGIPINKTDKFRNQRVIVTVYVPVGKQIRVNQNTGWGNHIQIDGPGNDDWSLETAGVEHGWEKDTDYIMKEDGLYTLDGIPADDWKNDEDRVRSGRRGLEIRDGKNRVRINENGIQ